MYGKNQNICNLHFLQYRNILRGIAGSPKNKNNKIIMCMYFSNNKIVKK